MIKNNKEEYRQKEKNKVRHSIIYKAVRCLTQERELAAIVKRDYVRRVYDYFNDTTDISSNKNEVQLIDKKYITSWEELHDAYISKKSVKELSVCYLCGPEPNNDFLEFIELGILPQNIWALESKNSTYNHALENYCQGEYPQPRIIKQNIETFFKMTPKKFDIIYVDACGCVPSTQHALRIVSVVCQYSRLNSPGVIITNFSSPDLENEKEQINDWIEVIGIYMYFKKYPEDPFEIKNGTIVSKKYYELINEIEKDLKKYYGEFISALLRDIPSVIIPIQRIQGNPYFQQFMVENEFSYSNLEWIKMSSGNSLARFFFFCNEIQSNNVKSKIGLLVSEFGELINIVNGFKYIVGIRSGINELKDDIKDIYKYFENNKELYQFLDKPHSNLIFDAIINQLIYPLHFNPEMNVRYKYKAKMRNMYTDVSVFDECRYIYEWLPAIHQVKSVCKNLSWQYVFRFCIDGLIRTRIDFNNEFFYQGSVVQHIDGEFEKAHLLNRINIKNI